MLTEDQRMASMYTGVVHCLNTESGFRLIRSQVLTPVNAAAVPLVMSTKDIGLYYLVGAIGFIVCIFWLVSNRRSQKRISYLHKRLAEMEPPEYYTDVFRIFTGPKWQEVNKIPWLYGVNFLPYLFVVIWIVVGFMARFPKHATSFFNFLLERGIL